MPQTTINPKVIHTMKKLQALCNVNVNKTIKKAIKEKSAIKYLNFPMNLTMVASCTKPVPEEPQTFNAALDHPNKEKVQEEICKESADIKPQQV